MAKADLERERQAWHAYHAKWQRFIEAGLHPVVISRHEHPEPWQRWESYFRLNSLLVQLEVMQALGTKSVPCLDPDDFTDPKGDGEAT